REGFAVEVQEVAPGRPNVIGTLGEKSAGRKSLLLEGHTDVVTEGDPREWSWPPFGAELADGRIYGRGAADMKGGLAAAMVAAAAFRRAGVEPRGQLVGGARGGRGRPPRWAPATWSPPRWDASWMRPSSVSPRRTSSVWSSAASSGPA